jgi:hypothetical protein
VASIITGNHQLTSSSLSKHHSQTYLTQPLHTGFGFSRLFLDKHSYKAGIKRCNHQHFVRNGLASAVVSRTADQHESGLGFTPCPFAGQPLHVMKSIIYRNAQAFAKRGIVSRVNSTAADYRLGARYIQVLIHRPPLLPG